MVAKKEQQGKKIQELYHKMASVQSVRASGWSCVLDQLVTLINIFGNTRINGEIWFLRYWRWFLHRIGKLWRGPVTTWGMRWRSLTARWSDLFFQKMENNNKDVQRLFSGGKLWNGGEGLWGRREDARGNDGQAGCCQVAHWFLVFD